MTEALKAAEKTLKIAKKNSKEAREALKVASGLALQEASLRAAEANLALAKAELAVAEARNKPSSDFESFDQEISRLQNDISDAKKTLALITTNQKKINEVQRSIAEITSNPIDSKADELLLSYDPKAAYQKIKEEIDEKKRQDVIQKEQERIAFYEKVNALHEQKEPVQIQEDVEELEEDEVDQNSLETLKAQLNLSQSFPDQIAHFNELKTKLAKLPGSETLIVSATALVNTLNPKNKDNLVMLKATNLLFVELLILSDPKQVNKKSDCQPMVSAIQHLAKTTTNTQEKLLINAVLIAAVGMAIALTAGSITPILLAANIGIAVATLVHSASLLTTGYNAYKTFGAAQEFTNKEKESASPDQKKTNPTQKKS